MFANSLFNQASQLFNIQPKVMAEEKLSEDKFAHQRLGQALKDNLGVDMPPEKTVNEAKSLFDVEAVVDTVMQHISKRMDEAKAGGASDDELQSMMDAAREGVEKGFSQAREQIETAGKMDDPLAEKIGEAEEGIYKGIDDLQERTFNPDSGEKYSKAEGRSEVYAMQFEQMYERQKNDFSFELTTQEGDKVTINAMSESMAYAESFREQSENGSVAYEGYASSQSSGYSFSVEGDLNEDEMAAIESLMSQVNDLADEFYNGDAMSAFGMAMDLTSDPEQIAQFSLDMSLQVESAYQGVAQAGQGYDKPSLPKGVMQPLQQFAEGVQQAAKTAEAFQFPHELVQSMFDQMDQQEPKLNSFLQPMLEAMKG